MNTKSRALGLAIIAVVATACGPLPTLPSFPSLPTGQKQAPSAPAKPTNLAFSMGVPPGYVIQKTIAIPGDACGAAQYAYAYRMAYIGSWNDQVVPAENRYAANLKKDPSNAKTKANLAIYKGKKIIAAVETPPATDATACYETQLTARTAASNDARADARVLQAQEQPQY